jgi:hypothetical protein
MYISPLNIDGCGPLALGHIPAKQLHHESALRGDGVVIQSDPDHDHDPDHDRDRDRDRLHQFFLAVFMALLHYAEGLDHPELDV